MDEAEQQQGSAAAETGQELTKIDSSACVARKRIPLEKGWARAKLIRQLALTDTPQTLLAEEYGVTQSSISEFKKRHSTEIEQVRNNTADEFCDLWIADKRSRLAELQQAAEKLAEKPDARSAEVLAKLLKDAAEELGSLPVRNQVNVNTANVTYEVHGVDTDVLR